MNLGNAIKELRKIRGISQKELAGRCGLSANTMCNIENSTSFPSKSSFDKICKALDVPSAYIFLYAITDDDIPERKRFIYKEYLEKNLKDLVLSAING